MSQINGAITARQTQIAQLQGEIEILQRASSIVGPPATAASKPRPKPKRKQKPALKPQSKQARPKAKQKKRRQWTAAEKAAIGKRMKAYWAKRRKAMG